MPPTPDRPRKPAGPARGASASPQSAPKTLVKSAPTPGPQPTATPRPVQPLAQKSEPRRDESVLRFSLPAWWGIILAVGIILIIFFEFGYTVGQQQAERARAAGQIEVAAAKPTETPKSPSPEVKPPPKAISTTATPPKETKATTPVEPPKKSNPPPPPVPAPAKKEEPAKEVEAAIPSESTAALKFDKDIFPIFQTKCLSCHGGLSKKGGLDLRTLTSIARGGNSGAGMKPGRPQDSPVWQSVKAGEMPPANKPQLTAEEKQLILKWIAGGGK
jgi:mono/diheme cytochrome c family protein